MHICKRCGKNELNNGHTRCDECLEKQRDYNKKYYETVDKEKRYLVRKNSGMCTSCGKEPNNGKCNYCQKCHSLMIDKGRDRQFKISDSGLCVTCRVNKADDGYKTCLRCRDNSSKWYINRGKQKKIKERQELKLKIFDHYGNKCNCCGEDIFEFLTIDHINNDGADHRRKLTGDKIRNGSSFVYKWIVQNNFPSSVQLLCWNCNCGKRMNNGICPHHNN